MKLPKTFTYYRSLLMCSIKHLNPPLRIIKVIRKDYQNYNVLWFVCFFVLVFKLHQDFLGIAIHRYKIKMNTQPHVGKYKLCIWQYTSLNFLPFSWMRWCPIVSLLLTCKEFTHPIAEANTPHLHLMFLCEGMDNFLRFSNLIINKFLI